MKRLENKASKNNKNGIRKDKYSVPDRKAGFFVKKVGEQKV